ncbi:hypothetical protein ES705_35020 [subsurface metagenome]
MKKLCFLIIVLFLFFGCEKNIFTEIAVDEDTGALQISNTTWSFEEKYISYLIVKGIVKNVGSTTLDYVKIYSKAYNDSDQLISSDYTFVDNWDLDSGQETSWKITDYDCENKPNKVTIGYSYDVTVSVPAPKK